MGRKTTRRWRQGKRAVRREPLRRVGVVAVVLILIVSSLFVRAELQPPLVHEIIYPQSCRGTWRGVENIFAQELDAAAVADDFEKKNSATPALGEPRIAAVPGKEEFNAFTLTLPALESEKNIEYGIENIRPREEPDLQLVIPPSEEQRTESPEERAENLEHGTQNLEQGAQNEEPRMESQSEKNIEYRIENIGPGMENTETRTENLENVEPEPLSAASFFDGFFNVARADVSESTESAPEPTVEPAANSEGSGVLDTLSHVIDKVADIIDQTISTIIGEPSPSMPTEEETQNTELEATNRESGIGNQELGNDSEKNTPAQGWSASGGEQGTDQPKAGPPRAENIGEPASAALPDPTTVGPSIAPEPTTEFATRAEEPTGLFDTLSSIVNKIVEVIDNAITSLTDPFQSSTPPTPPSPAPTSDNQEIIKPAGETENGTVACADFGPASSTQPVSASVGLSMNWGASQGLLVVEYTQDGQTWQPAGSITQAKSETSNQPEYYTLPLPSDFNANKLELTRLRLRWYGDFEGPNIAVDSVWLDIASESTTSGAIAPTLTSSAAVFSASSEPTFDLSLPARKASRLGKKDTWYLFSRAAAQGPPSEPSESSESKGKKWREPDSEIAVKLLDKDKNPTDLVPQIKRVGAGRFKVNLDARQFQPGRYILQTTVSQNSETQTLEQDFSWGVLVVNTDQSVYKTGDTANLYFGVLTELGHTVCDASITAVITDPLGNATTLSTTDNTIAPSGQCQGDSVTDLPDYAALYQTASAGRYELTATADNGNGPATVTDSFLVTDELPFRLRRQGATRLYPLANYRMILEFTPQADFSGTVTEYIPASYGVVDAGGAVVSELADGSAQQLRWEVAALGGQTQTLSYEYDPVNLSPAIFKLGQAEVANNIDGVVFTEYRYWLLASDTATGFKPVVTWAAITSSAGDNDGFGTTSGASPTDPTTINAGYLEDMNSGTAGNTTCSTSLPTDRDQEEFYGFDFSSVPSGATINGIEVKYTAHSDSSLSSPALCFQLYSTSTAKGSPIAGANLTASDSTETLGSASNLWGWTNITTTDLASGTFRVRSATLASSSARDFWLDYLAVQITYTAASTITVSGTAYTDEGSTRMSGGATVRLRVNGTGTYNTTLNNSCPGANCGDYSIASVTANASDVITVWLDTGGGNQATAVTRVAATPANITDLHLYQNRVIVRHEDAGPITNTDLGQCDNDSPAACTDTDIGFTSNTGTLTVVNTRELHVWTGNTFTPGGTVTLNTGTSPGGDLHIVGTMDTSTNQAVNADRLNIDTGGTLTASGSTITLRGTAGTLFTRVGTFTANSSTVVMNGVTTGAALTLTSGTITFYTLQLTPNISAARTYDFGSGAITVSNNFDINPTGSAALTVNMGAAITVSGTTTITRTTSATSILDTRPSTTDYNLTTAKLDIQAGGTLDAGGSASTITITGSSSTLFTLNASGTFTAGSSTVKFSLGTIAINPITSGTFTGSNAFYNLTTDCAAVLSAPTHIFGNGALAVNNNLTVSLGVASVVGCNVNMGADITVSGGTTISGLVAKTMTFNTSASNYNFTTSTLNIASVGALTANASIITLTGTSGTLFTLTGTFTQGTSEVKVTSASGTPTLLSAATTFHILTINAAATIINAGAGITTDNVAGNKLYVQSGVFNTEGNSVTPGTSGTLQIDSGGTLCIGGTTGATTATCDSGATQTSATTFPAFTTYTFNASSTVIYLNDAAQTIDGTPTYGNLKLAPKLTADRTYTFELSTTPTINGDFTINPTASSTTKTLLVNMAGAITVASTKTTTISGTTTGASNMDTISGSNYALSTGSLNITNSGSGGTLTAQGATITLTGTGTTVFTNSGTFTYGTSTVKYTGGGATTVLSMTGTGGTNGYYDLATATGVGPFNAGGNIVANHAVNVGSGTLAMSTYNLTVGTGTTTGDIYGAGAISQAASGTTAIKGAGVIGGIQATTCSGASGSYQFYNLTVGDNANIKTTIACGSFTVSNVLTINGGTANQTLDASSVTITLSGAGTPITRLGVFTGGTSTVAYTSGTGVTALSSAAMTGTNAFYQLEIGGSGTFTAGVNIQAGGYLNVNTGATLAGTNDITVNILTSGAGTINLTGGTFEHRMVGVGESFGTSSGLNDWTFNNLTFSNADVSSRTIAISSGTGTITVTGILLVSKTGDAAATVMSSGTRTFILSNPNTAKPFNLDQASGSLSAGTSTFVYSGNNAVGDVTIENASSYNKLTVGGSSAENYTPEAAITVNDDLTIDTNATLIGASNVTAKGNVTGAGTVNLTGGTFEQIVAADKTFGSSSGTNTWTFSGLKFNNSSGVAGRTITPNAGTGAIVVSGTMTLGDSGTQIITFDNNTANDRVFDLNGALLISTQGSFTASNTAAFTAAGNFTNNGTFTHSSGTVTFDTTGTSLIDGSGTPAVTLYNFTSTTGSKIIQFKATKTFRIDGKLTITGASGSQITIDSDTTSSQWLINHQGTEDVTYANIQDSGCAGGTTNISLNSTSTDSGNNGACWLFPSLSFTISPTSISLDLNSGNSFTTTATNTLTVTSRSGLGYSLTAYITGLLTHLAYPSSTIANWTGAHPTGSAWGSTCIAASQCGFGYNTSDADIGMGTNYAAFSQTAPGDEVAKASDAVTSDATTITYRSSVSAIQAAGPYQTTVIYIVTPQF